MFVAILTVQFTLANVNSDKQNTCKYYNDFRQYSDLKRNVIHRQLVQHLGSLACH